MTVDNLTPALALGTLCVVAGFALWIQNRTRQLKTDPDHRKSALAADAPEQYAK